MKGPTADTTNPGYCSAMEDPPDDLLKLPKGLDSPDPIDGNPFPESDIRHGFWKSATKVAEDEHSLLVVGVSKRPRPRDPRNLDAMIAWDLALFTAKYDIWAKRGVCVVLSEELLDSWYEWLANYANEMLKTFAKIAPPDRAIQTLRNALIGRREHWKAEGRRCVEFQQAHQAQLAARQAKGDVSAELPSLAERVTRILEIRWSGLLESYQLSGERVVGYASASDSTRKLALDKPPDVKQENRYLGQWLSANQRAKHECGISSSVAVAQARFGDLATQYLKLWPPSAGWELFARWLELLKVRVLGEIASIWKGTSTTKSWYETVCKPAVIATLSATVKEFEGRARLDELVSLARVQGDQLRTPGSGLAQAKVNGEPEPDVIAETEAKAKPVEDGDQKRSLTWDDIAICFLDPERVEVKVGDNVKHLHYAEMGFADRRGRAVGDRGPVDAWNWLMHLAKNRRIIEVAFRRAPNVARSPVNAERPMSQLQELAKQRGSSVKARTKLQAAVKDLRRRLRLYFPNVPGEPIVFEETQYRALFQVGTAEHFPD